MNSRYSNENEDNEEIKKKFSFNDKKRNLSCNKLLGKKDFLTSPTNKRYSKKREENYDFKTEYSNNNNIDSSVENNNIEKNQKINNTADSSKLENSILKVQQSLNDVKFLLHDFDINTSEIKKEENINENDKIVELSLSNKIIIEDIKFEEEIFKSENLIIEEKIEGKCVKEEHIKGKLEEEFKCEDSIIIKEKNLKEDIENEVFKCEDLVIQGKDVKEEHLEDELGKGEFKCENLTIKEKSIKEENLEGEVEKVFECKEEKTFKEESLKEKLEGVSKCEDLTIEGKDVKIEHLEGEVVKCKVKEDNLKVIEENSLIGKLISSNIIDKSCTQSMEFCDKSLLENTNDRNFFKLESLTSKENPCTFNDENSCILNSNINRENTYSSVETPIINKLISITDSENENELSKSKNSNINLLKIIIF